MHAAVTLLPYAMQHKDDNTCHQNITTLLQGQLIMTTDALQSQNEIKCQQKQI